MALAMPQAIERLLAKPTIKARLPSKKPIVLPLYLPVNSAQLVFSCRE